MNQLCNVRRTAAFLGLLLIGCTKEINLDDPDAASTKQIQTANQTTKVLIDNNSVWTDTDGNEIKAQGGGIIKVENIYHWFGSQFKEPGEGYRFVAINHYTSTDLKNWTKQTPALTPATPGVPFSASSWVGRPWVM
jgi:hypothetical protein